MVMMRHALLTIKEVFALRRNGYSGPFFMALLLMGAGIQLLIPNETFGDQDKYRVMAEFASEEAWGIGMVGIALMLTVACLARKPREVALASLPAALAWFIVFGSFTAARPVSVIVPITFVLILRCISLYREFMYHPPHPEGEPPPQYRNARASDATKHETP
jgi:predicted exporter